MSDLNSEHWLLETFVAIDIFQKNSIDEINYIRRQYNK